MLNDKQRELAEKNRNLVYAIMNRDFKSMRGRQDYEDWVQVGMLGLCIAAETWDSNYAKFEDYAAVVIRNEILEQLQFNSRKRREPEERVLSLDDEDVIAMFNACLSMKSPTIETLINYNTGVQAILKVRNPRHRSILIDVANGYSVAEAARRNGLTRQAARAMIARFGEKLKDDLFG